MNRVSFHIGLTLAVLFLAALKTHASDRNKRILESESFYSHALGQQVRYSVLLPIDYFSSNRSYPVVYLLHGLGDNETSWLEYGRIQQIADKLTKQSQIDPMIFVMPQGFDTYYVNFYDGSFPYQDMFVNELIPYIDQTYRTIAQKSGRALVGYSMGGFGALALALKHPEKFIAAVPLSISIRTDEQYALENASEWNRQWGRIFGGEQKTGNERLTPYYMLYSPFYLIDINNKSGQDVRIYIDTGDDEQTLAISNEALHIHMRNHHFPHEYRVRNGGHTFTYWREAMPNGLRFVNDAFAGKAYRGDLNDRIRTNKPAKAQLSSILIGNNHFEVYLPPCYQSSTRLYPVLLVIGDIDTPSKSLLAGKLEMLINKGLIPPMIMLFARAEQYQDAISGVYVTLRARKGHRFIAVMGIGEGAQAALSLYLNPGSITACALIDGDFDMDAWAQKLSQISQDGIGNTWLYVEQPDKGLHYKANGQLHMLLREKTVYHEYRVSEGEGGISWTLIAFENAMYQIAEKLHR